MHPLGRRALTVPGTLGAFAFAVLFAPLLFAVAAVADLLTGPHRWRHVRLLAMVTLALGVELVGIAIATLLWFRHGFGRGFDTPAAFRNHHRLQCWYIDGLLSSAKLTCGLRIEVEDPSPAAAGNAIVIGRHTSIADAAIPAMLFANHFDINTRYILKDDLLWGPAFDIVGNRLLNHFVDRSPADSPAERAAIRRLTEDFDEHAVAVIFPEGTFFTPARKERAIARLRERGEDELARRADALRHLLPPRPGGTLALFEGAPHADVVVMGNTGLEQFTSLGRIYRGIPFRDPVRVWLWRVPAAERPSDPADQVRWLYDQWARLDASIDARLTK